jgi:hypothetical protein
MSNMESQQEARARWNDIQEGMRFTESLYQSAEPEPAAEASAAGGDNPPNDDVLSVADALAILRLTQSPILQQILQSLQSQADGLDGKAKNLKNSNPQRYMDKCEGIKTALAAFSSNFADAIERVKSASNDERLSFSGSDAQLFAQVTGKSATVSAASKFAPRVNVSQQVVDVKTAPAQDAREVLENTRKAIAHFSGEKK